MDMSPLNLETAFRRKTYITSSTLHNIQEATHKDYEFEIQIIDDDSEERRRIEIEEFPYG